VQRLPIEPVSQASADQRAGRCGRLGPGICIRLYDEEGFADRPASSEEFLAHWQASFQRNSMHGLCLTRAQDDELIFILKDFMRITSVAGKRNVNLKRNLHQTIHEVFGIMPAYVEQALSALGTASAELQDKTIGSGLLHRHRILCRIETPGRPGRSVRFRRLIASATRR
jgi:hypothetical protein